MTLTKGDLADIEEIVREATWDTIDNAMSKHQIVLGELCT